MAGPGGMKNVVMVQNLPMILRNLDLLFKQAESQIEKGLWKAALVAEAEAVRLVSSGTLRAVNTGLMRASTRARKPTKVSNNVWQAIMGVNPGYTASGFAGSSKGPFYVLFVHEGTSKMPARPYIRRALTNKKDKIRSILKNSIVNPSAVP